MHFAGPYPASDRLHAVAEANNPSLHQMPPKQSPSPACGRGVGVKAALTLLRRFGSHTRPLAAKAEARPQLRPASRSDRSQQSQPAPNAAEAVPSPACGRGVGVRAALTLLRRFGSHTRPLAAKAEARPQLRPASRSDRSQQSLPAPNAVEAVPSPACGRGVGVRAALTLLRRFGSHTRPLAAKAEARPQLTPASRSDRSQQSQPAPNAAEAVPSPACGRGVGVRAALTLLKGLAFMPFLSQTSLKKILTANLPAGLQANSALQSAHATHLRLHGLHETTRLVITTNHESHVPRRLVFRQEHRRRVNTSSQIRYDHAPDRPASTPDDHGQLHCHAR